MADTKQNSSRRMDVMIDPDHSVFRTYREDNRGAQLMSHIPYYGEDKVTAPKKDAKPVDTNK